MGYVLHHGDCLDILPTLPAQSVDAVITDPPYPEIDRPYGRLTEAQWWDLMMGVCKETRRILKPTGSAVFILQPNSRKVGSMRGWLWEFMAWVCREWNMVQDVWWWNTKMPPTIHTQRVNGLMRPSVKPCVWAGEANCYRQQDNILWDESDANKALRQSGRARTDWTYHPSGHHFRESAIVEVAAERGGVTPFNLLPYSAGNSTSDSGAYGHGAGTPLKLADWWTRYIAPTGGTVLDPFNGAGTMGIAAIQNGCNYVGIEQDAGYVATSHARIAAVQPALMEAAD